MERRPGDAKMLNFVSATSATSATGRCDKSYVLQPGDQHAQIGEVDQIDVAIDIVVHGAPPSDLQGGLEEYSCALSLDYSNCSKAGR